MATNLFGSPTTNSALAVGTTTKPSSLTASTTASDSASSKSWFEEDDTLFLSKLLLGEITTSKEDELNGRFDRVRIRLEEDLSQINDVVGSGGVGSSIGEGDGWWDNLINNANSSGFTITSNSQPQPSTTNNNSNKKELPKSFTTNEGQIHIRALSDLLGISDERAVQITLASLRTFAATVNGGTANNIPPSTSTPTNNSGDNKNEPVTTPESNSDNKENKSQSSSEEESKLRSLLGTTQLFQHVLSYHRLQFISRLRIVTECLRLEQEFNEHDDDNVESYEIIIGRCCKQFLNGLDSKLKLNNSNNRGLFYLLLRLSTGPSLFGLGSLDLPHSISKLYGNNNNNNTTTNVVLQGSEETILSIHTESSEAMLVLLYDRINNGVQRFDLFLIMEALKNCNDYEFGMTSNQYSKFDRILQGGIRGGVGVGWQEHYQLLHNTSGLGSYDTTPSSSVKVMEQTKYRLNAIWGLICAECMGLWHTSSSSSTEGGESWVNNHPFFTNGLDNQQTQLELTAIHQKINELGNCVRERRNVAYNAYKKQHRAAQEGGGGGMDSDDELWGVQAPESICLLSFGLLVRLASMSQSSQSNNNEFVKKLSDWGNECSQMANDECGAFAYLHQIVEGMVCNSSGGGGTLLSLERRRLRSIGNEKMASDLLKRSEFEMLNEQQNLALMDEGMALNDKNDDNTEEEDLLINDAASIVYASIAREILTATIRSFREALLSLTSRTSAVENIGMLADLASVIYRNSKILCESFWLDWEEFCQQGSSDDDAMNDDSNKEELKGGEPLCYLLDAAHTLAVSTLSELKSQQGQQQQQQQAVIHYLNSLATFLNLIVSLCATPSMVRSILTSDFLPDGLIGSALSVVAALAPLLSSLNESSTGHEGVSSEERSTVKYATTIIHSISTLANLGGKDATNWVRKSLSGGPRMICNIAREVLPRTQSTLEGECTDLAASALNLLVDLLVDADVEFQVETCNCFLPISTGGFGGGGDKMSGFAQFVVTGGGGEITLSAISILNSLSVNLTRNVFDSRVVSSSGVVLGLIETIGSGVMVALDVLSSLASSGEVTFPTSKIQIATAHAILSSVTASLISLKQVLYLHEDDNVRSLALSVRNDIVSTLSSSTPLGQVIAFLSSIPISLMLMKSATSSRNLAAVIDSASAVQQDKKKQNGSSYGPWGKFVTPKRASQRRATAAKKQGIPNTNMLDNLAEEEDGHLELYNVVSMALSLLLVWGENAEDIAATLSEESPDQNVLLQASPCTLLLSKASPSSLVPQATTTITNVANLNLISHLVSNSDDVLVGGAKSDAALLSSKVVKMCLRHSTVASDPSIGLSTFRAALGGGQHMFNVLLDAVEKLVGDDASAYSQGLGRVALLATTMLESVAVSASTQPDLAQSILLGGENKQDWRLVDKMVSIITSTGELMTKSREDQVDERMLNLQSLLTCACLKVVSELWSSCRLTTCKRRPSNSDGAHACESIVAHLTNKTSTTSLVANAVVELTRCSLLAIMSLEEKNSMQDEISTVLVNQKCILLDMLSLSLDIISIETVSRVQAKAQGGIKFIEDLYDSGPMDCWKVLLSSSDASASAASSWLTSFTESVGRTGTANWNLASFSYANSAEKDTSSSSWCSVGLGASFARALDSDSNNSASTFKSCNALQVLARSEASFSASWASFFEVVTANVYATLPSNEVYALTSTLVDCTLTALSSVSVSKMTAESLLSSQGLLESSDTKPVEELCSLLLYSLKVKQDVGDSAESSGAKSVLEMIERLYESSNKLFVMTQLGSVASNRKETVCLIRQSLLASALVLISEFESLSQANRSRDDMVKYNDLRIGLTDLAVNALQSLKYTQQGDDNDNTAVEEVSAPSKCGYGFGSSAPDDDSDAAQGASFQLLRTSLSLLSRLAPTTMGSSSKMNDFLSLTYGVDFASCLKGRNAIHYIQYHLGAASTVASLTYQAVHAGTSTQSVAMIHHNAVDVVRVITVFFHTLTDAGSTVLDILLLLADNRVFRSLIDNPLMKTAGKTWSSNTESSMGADDQVMSTITRHRGYYTSFPRQQPGSKSKPKPCSQKDSAHFVWREVISIFSSLLRSARFQAQAQQTNTVRQLASSTLDFVSAYEYVLFSCLTSMLNEAKAQSNKSNKGQSKTSFSSSIKSASYAFTPNLLSESSAISSLFAELCSDGDIRNEFARQCSSIYKRVLSTSAEMTKISSAFLGAISSARELFLALESASTITGSSFAEGVHPLLVDGIPHARHEAIRNAHFAHSCCILATAEDFKNSHIATTKAAEAASGKDSSLEQSFQIHVNNKLIAEVECVAGHCLFNALSVLSDTHPSSNSFVTFTREEASHINVAEVIKAGTTVALSSSVGAQQFQRYQVQSNGRDVQYARTLGVDQSSRTISVEFSDTGAIDRHVPWSCIVGMEDTSKRHCVFSYLPVPRSIAEADTPQGQPSLGNLILSLKWCRHVASTSMNESTASCSLPLIKCISERTAILLCTEVLLHDEIRGGASPRDDDGRRVNMQLLDLFEDDSPSTDAGLAPSSPSGRGSKQNFALVLGEDLMASIQNNLQIHLEAASIERDEEMKLWAQNNAGWDNSSLLGSSGKRQGRRSPFRLTRKLSSGDLS